MKDKKLTAIAAPLDEILGLIASSAASLSNAFLSTTTNLLDFIRLLLVFASIGQFVL